MPPVVNIGMSGEAWHPLFVIKDINYVASGDAEGLAEGLGAAALSRVVLMAFKSTMEVYLLSSE